MNEWIDLIQSLALAILATSIALHRIWHYRNGDYGR